MLGEEILLPNSCRCCLLEDKDMVYVFDVLDEFEMQISDLIVRNGAVTVGHTARQRAPSHGSANYTGTDLLLIFRSWRMIPSRSTSVAIA
ncbi:AGAP012820-PA-like protein [Anopheles sinensis]|uniref:AGAP012820-PA-like protein n=1 Tax=Anopheles sinensis TaxID=74873 RepID=A0A084WSM2_ANOSI|nr:AGAP012820-PA-like protein [Anopheles sinensis]